MVPDKCSVLVIVTLNGLEEKREQGGQWNSPAFMKGYPVFYGDINSYFMELQFACNKMHIFES